MEKDSTTHIRLDTSPSTDIGRPPTRHEGPRRGRKRELLAGFVEVTDADFDLRFSTIFKRPLFMHTEVVRHNNSQDDTSESGLSSMGRIPGS